MTGTAPTEQESSSAVRGPDDSCSLDDRGRAALENSRTMAQSGPASLWDAAP
jgi:hypothetical protein